MASANIAFTATYLKRPTATERGKLGVRILPQAVTTAEVIRNINIALVIDQSGSMEGDRITSVKRTIRLLIQQLQNGDTISLVAFSNRAATLIRSATISDETRRQVEEAVDRLVADGGTNLECGIAELGSFVQQTGMPDAVVILTDGHINEGISSAAGLSSVIGSYLQSTPIYTLGYGTDHNGDLLRSLATRTCGTYTFIDNEIVLPASVGDLLGGLQGEVAKSAELSYPEEWKCEEPVDQNNPGIRSLGSLISDKPTWVMLSLPPASADSDVVLTYKMGDEEKRVVVQPSDSGLDSVEMEEQFLRCVTGHTLDKVAAAIRGYQMDEAKTLLEATLAEIDASPAKQRPLCIRMKAQLVEMKEQVEQHRVGHGMRRQNAVVGLGGAALGPTPAGGFYGGAPSIDAMLLRTTSTASNYGAQRGVTSLGGAALGPTASDGIFSSPTAVRRNRQMVSHYSQGGSNGVVEESEEETMDSAHTVAAAIAAIAAAAPLPTGPVPEPTALTSAPTAPLTPVASA